MNDPLKKYIQDNRDDFDHLEPSPDIFFKLKKDLKDVPETKGVIRLGVNFKWLAVASILIIMSITYIILSNQNINSGKEQSAQTKPATISDQPLKVAMVERANEPIKTAVKATRKKVQKQVNSINMLAIYRDLTDSSSASTRLAAILSIQKSNIISYDIIDKLTKTLNYDSNSNVRLAALNLMSKYAQDSYVSNAFMLSLTGQKDPLVQMGLIELLSQSSHPTLDDKLYALANDPTTFSEVKDRAYLVLLNHNKL